MDFFKPLVRRGMDAVIAARRARDRRRLPVIGWQVTIGDQSPMWLALAIASTAGCVSIPPLLLLSKLPYAPLAIVFAWAGVAFTVLSIPTWLVTAPSFVFYWATNPHPRVRRDPRFAFMGDLVDLHELHGAVVTLERQVDERLDRVRPQLRRQGQRVQHPLPGDARQRRQDAAELKRIREYATVTLEKGAMGTRGVHIDAQELANEQADLGQLATRLRQRMARYRVFLANPIQVAPAQPPAAPPAPAPAAPAP